MRAKTVLLGIAFTLSGGAALLAEQIFEKLLSTLVGASTPAGAVVLSVYFAGLTAGALLYPRARRLRLPPLALYPALELLVVVACGVLAWRYEALVPTFAPLLRLGVGSPATLALLRAVVAAAWILPLTLPMGATFPAIVDAVDRIPGAKGGRTLSTLYAVNLAGAIAAAVLGPIAVFPVTGMRGGLLFAGGLDVVAAILGLVVALASPEGASRREGGAVAEAPAEAERGARVPAHLWLLAGATGLLLFALEVSWTHLACAVIGNSVYAFASMLASVLVGLGLGGAASAVVFPRRGSVPPWAPGGALIAGAVALECEYPLWPRAPHVVAWLGSQTTSFAGAELARFAVAAGLLVPPAAVLGLAYPLLFRVPSFPRRERGGAAGRITAVNAVGCILGSLAAGFVLLPRLGSEGTARALIVTTAVAGAVAAAAAQARRVALGAAGLVLLIAVLLPRWDVARLTSGEHVYFRPQSDPDETDLVFVHEDTLGGITTVTKTRDRDAPPLRTLYTNGKFQGNDGGEMVAQTSFAFVPTQYVSRFDRALVIGLGTGRTAGALARMGFGALEIAEIAPGIVGAARTEFAGVNEHVLERPNVTLILEDGRNLLLLRDATYDLVAIELTSVWFAGATSLYSREFYALVKDRLRPGGVLQQWIQLHHIGQDELTSVLATVRAVFPVVSLFVLGGQGIIVASDAPQEVQPAFAEHLRSGGIAGFLGLADDAAVEKLLADGRLLAPADVDRLAARPGLTLNTDANRLLEYATPKYNYRRDDLFGANVRGLRAIAGL